MKRLEVTANLAVIVTSVLLLALLWHTWHEKQRVSQSRMARTQALVGSTIQLPGVDFTKKEKTLLIAISETCHFCRESQPFYKELAGSSSATTNLFVVLPAPQTDAEKYVHTTISPSLHAASAPLDTIGVSATPTLLLVDNRGKVTKAWIGKLNDAGQKQVQSAL